MADNYLENKMAEHMAGNSRTAARRASSGGRQGFLEIKFPPRRVLIAGNMNIAMTAAATALVNAGCRVAMLGGTVAGARCFPADTGADSAISRLFHDWHEIDVLIIAGDAPGVAEALKQTRLALPAPLRATSAHTIIITEHPDATTRDDANTIIITDPAAHAHTAARTCLYLCSPDARHIHGSRIVLS